MAGSPTSANTVKPSEVDALHAKIKAADEAGTKEMLQRTPNLVFTQSEKGYAALYLASMHADRLGCLRAVLAVRPNLDEKGEDKETALYIAVFNNNIEAVRLLIASGAKVNEVNGFEGETPLGCAARLGFVLCLEALIDADANVNLRSMREKETPLFAAAKAGKVETAYILLQKGATKTLPNIEGKEPLYIASERDHKHVAALLKTDKAYLREVKGHIDVELRLAPPPIFEGVRKAEAAAEAAKRKSPKKTSPTKSPGKKAPAPSSTVKKAAPAPAGKKAASGAAAAPPPKPQEKPAAAERPEEQRGGDFIPLDPERPSYPIVVPQPAARSRDPFTGLELPKCKTMLEAGAYEPEPASKEAIDKLAAVRGGTSEAPPEYGGTKPTYKLFEPAAGGVDENVLLPAAKRQAAKNAPKA